MSWVSLPKAGSPTTAWTLPWQLAKSSVSLASRRACGSRTCIFTRGCPFGTPLGIWEAPVEGRLPHSADGNLSAGGGAN